MASWDEVQPRLHLDQHPSLNPRPFTTTIRSVENEGIVLEESFCYPRGGGQPGDIGSFRINDEISPFNEVIAHDRIYHPVDNLDDFQIGEELICSIDIQRRNALSQTHTTQHVVSAMADEIWGASTVGNQLGTDESRIDFLFEDKNQFDVEEITESVNAILGANHTVSIGNWHLDQIMQDDRVRNRTFVSKILSRLPRGMDSMRVVEISGIDICPCAGSHVGNTRELSQIEVTKVKQKGAGKLRVYYTMKNTKS